MRRTSGRPALLADVHPLLCAVAHLTGDLSLLREDFAPDQGQLLVAGCGLGPEAMAEARALAASTLAAHLAAGRPDHEVTPDERRRIFGFLVGAGAAAHWETFLNEELALEGSDPRHPSWHMSGLQGAFRCAVIGAGASGLAAAHRLRQAGVTVTVFEKNSDVGGTWLENVYPGCRVDVPNQLYSFSFAQSNDWVSRFSAQPDLLAYLQATAERLDLGESIRFGSEVTEARFDDATQEWSLTVVTGDGAGSRESIEAFDGIICAVGQLNRPSFPAIPGLERFAGPSFHSAAWDDTVELAGRRVGVIGSGASAAQFVPHLAGVVGHLDVYQRTPPWLLPTGELRRPVPARVPPSPAAAAELRALGPPLAVLAAARGTARGRPRRPRMGRAHRGGERGQRFRAVHAAGRPAGPGRGRRAVREDGPALPTLRQARPARRRALAGGAEPARCRPRDDADRRDHRARRAHRGRRGASDGRADLRDGVPGVGVRHAHEGLRRRRHRAERGVGRRRPGLPRHDGAGVPQLLLPLRAQHQPGDQRQHPHHGRVPGPLRRGGDRAPPPGRASDDVVPA